MPTSGSHGATTTPAIETTTTIADADGLGQLLAQGEAAHHLLVRVLLGVGRRVRALPVGIEYRGDVARSAVARGIRAARPRALLGCHVLKATWSVENRSRASDVEIFVAVHQRRHRPLVRVRLGARRSTPASRLAAPTSIARSRLLVVARREQRGESRRRLAIALDVARHDRRSHWPCLRAGSCRSSRRRATARSTRSLDAASVASPRRSRRPTNSITASPAASASRERRCGPSPSDDQSPRCLRSSRVVRANGVDGVRDALALLVTSEHDQHDVVAAFARRRDETLHLESVEEDGGHRSRTPRVIVAAADALTAADASRSFASRRSSGLRQAQRRAATTAVEGRHRRRLGARAALPNRAAARRVRGSARRRVESARRRATRRRDAAGDSVSGARLPLAGTLQDRARSAPPAPACRRSCRRVRRARRAARRGRDALSSRLMARACSCTPPKTLSA